MPFNPLNPADAVAAPALTVGAPKVSYGKTLLALRTELALRLGGRSDVDPTRLSSWINEAYLDMVSSLDLPELNSNYSFNTVAAKYLYLVPDQVMYAFSASLVDEYRYPFDGGLPLTKIDLSTYRKLPATVTGSTINSEQAMSFFRHGDLWVFWPDPSDIHVISIDFRIRPDPLVNDTDSPILKREWHEGLLLLAKAKAHEGLIEPDLAAASENTYVRWVRRRQDMDALEDTNKLVSASVVRSRRQLIRQKGGILGQRNAENSI